MDGLVLPAWPLSGDQAQKLLSAAMDRAGLDLATGNPPSAGGVVRTDVESGSASYWFGVLRTENGVQLTATILMARRRSGPWEIWTDYAREAAESIRRYPNGLVLFCHRGYSADVGPMEAWLRTRATGGSRYAYVVEGPPAMRCLTNVSSLCVEGTQESWEAALHALVAHDFDVIAIAGWNEREVLRQGLLTAWQDRVVYVGVSPRSVLDTILWVIGNPPLELCRIGPVLTGVVGTTLIRRVCPSCSYPAVADETVLAILREKGIRSLPKGNWVEGRGCDECNGFGFVPPMHMRQVLELVEILHVDRDLARLLESGPSRTQLESALRERGFRTCFEQAFELAREGLTTLKESIDKGLGRRADM